MTNDVFPDRGRHHARAGQPATNNNTGFGLKSTGGGVYLFDSLANGGSLLNSIIYGLQTPDLSIGRVPNGGNNWVLTSPTPGTANFAVPTFGDVNNLKVWCRSGIPASWSGRRRRNRARRRRG